MKTFKIRRDAEDLYGGIPNTYRRIQMAMLALKDAVENDLDEDHAKMVIQGLIQPMCDYFFQLHKAYEHGRQAGQIGKRR